MRNVETIYFGGGCFWGVEEAFRQIEGVKTTKVGFMGGNKCNPTYEDVKKGFTEHIEVVLVRYERGMLEHLLPLFFSIHDPTSRDKQGEDEGSQYRSAIFYESNRQYVEIRQKIGEGYVTDVRKKEIFYPAEDYHQQYLLKNGTTYCSINKGGVR